MATQCPKCLIENTKDSVFCKKCATPLRSADELSITKTIVKPLDELVIDSTFAEKYKIIAEIGRGGMGVVYKAEDLKLKRFVAIKLLPSELANYEEAKERFIQEAQAAAALSHPNICTIYEVEEAERKTYIAMEYIEGYSLRERTVKGPLSTEETLNVAIQVAQGLSEAHKKGITHRDIKSANIMVDEKGQAKIMDFGLAKVTGASLITKEAKTLGTVAYMSPEQARGDEVDHRTDIWSFGVVLYEMLTGQFPFRREEERSLIYSIENKEPAPIRAVNPDIPAAFEQIVKKALEKDKENRYQSIPDLEDELFSISKGIVPPKIEAALRKARFARLKRAYFYGGLVLLSVALIASLVHFLSSPARPSIAVLPFENKSKDPEIDYLCDGITEGIIDKLVRFPSLKVIARSSVFHYKGKEIVPQNVGKELAVGTVLVSWMKQSGPEASIRVELVNTRDSSLIWSHLYKRMSSEIFMIKEEIVSSIVENLMTKISPVEKDRKANVRQVNPKAHDAYLKGLHFRRKVTIEDTRRAGEYFQQAIEIDPNYALAYTGLAGVYRVQAAVGMQPKEAFAKAEAAAKKALELDDTLAVAYSHQAYVRFNYYWDWEGAERALKHAFELSPGDVGVHRTYATFLSRVGRHEEAISQWNRIMELDPISLTENTLEMGKLFYFARQFDSAIEQLQKTIELSPLNDVAHVYLSSAYVQKSMYEEALAAARKAGIYSNLAIALTLAKAGREEEARGMLVELTREWGIRIPTFIAWVYASLGEKDNAFEWLQKGYDQHDHFIHQMKVEPMFDPLRSDSRFHALLREMNFPE